MLFLATGSGEERGKGAEKKEDWKIIPKENEKEDAFT